MRHETTIDHDMRIKTDPMQISDAGHDLLNTQTTDSREPSIDLDIDLDLDYSDDPDIKIHTTTPPPASRDAYQFTNTNSNTMSSREFAAKLFDKEYMVKTLADRQGVTDPKYLDHMRDRWDQGKRDIQRMYDGHNEREAEREDSVVSDRAGLGGLFSNERSRRYR